MNLPYASKVVAAFLAGVVIALGGGLIYVRATESAHPQALSFPKAPAVDDRAAAVPAAPTAAQEQTPPATDNSAQTTPAPTRKPAERALAQPGKQKPPALKPHIASVHRPAVVRPMAPKAALQMAQNRPAPNPLHAPDVDKEPEPEPSVDPAPPDTPPDQPASEPQAESQTQPTSAPEPAPAPKRQPMTVTLAPGTGLVIRLGETLSTDHNYAGDTFRATLDAPIIRSGYIIADKGSKVLGRIAVARKPGRLDGVSELMLALTEINTTDGQRVRVATNTWDQKGASSAGQNTATIAGGAVLGAVIGGIAGGGKGAAIGAGAGGAIGTGAVLAGHAKPAVLPAETRLTFHLSGPVTITERLNF